MKYSLDVKQRIKQLKFFKANSKPMRLAAQGWDSDWKTLISIMMSAQSRDEITIRIASELFSKYASLEKLANAKYKDVLKIFRSLNYNKTKARHVVNCAKIIVEEYSGKVPIDFNELISLPGVGRKTANVFLSEFGGDNIGVDTHITYISKKMGWTKGKTQKIIEDDLKSVFPKKYWGSINEIIVGFGRSYTNKKEKDSLIAKAKLIK